MSSLRSAVQQLLVLVFFFCTRTNAEEECKYLQGDLQLANSTFQTVHLCELSDGFRYRLASHLLEGIPAEDLLSGQTSLLISGMVANTETRAFDADREDTGERPSIVAVNDVQHLVTGQITGTRSVLVVRVLSRDNLAPSFSQDTIRRNMFSQDVVSFSRQYSQCSNGALNFVAAGSGVVDLDVNMNLRGRAFSESVDGALASAFFSQIGPVDPYDHILFCLPGGMNPDFIAFAVLNDRYSFYADPWCSRLSATMHEVGHNLDLQHSGLNGDSEYADETGMMGIGYAVQQGPQKCFNGAKFWAFNWFPTQRRTVDPRAHGSYTGNLAAFVDAADTQMDMVIRVGDLYLVFNRATKHNSGVNGYRGHVTVVQANSPGDTSWLVGSLSPLNPSFTRGTVLGNGSPSSVTIEWCSANLGGRVESVRLSIRLAGRSSTCSSSTPSSPTPAPFFMANDQNPNGCSRVAEACGSTGDCCSGLRCLNGQVNKICINTNSVREAMSGHMDRRGGAGGARRLRLDEGRALGAM